MTQTSPSPDHYGCVMDDAQPGMSFADLIRTARQRRNWSQEDLETHSGVSRSTLSRWERGISDRPEPEHVRAVCVALNIDPRQAAVSLGYLTAEEVAGPTMPRHNPTVEEVVQFLEDTTIPNEVKQPWIDYLRYLREQHRRQRAG